MDDEALRKHLLIGFEYCYLHDDWVNPMSEALKGLSPADALWRPGPEGKGIWDIVLHLAVWNENIVKRVRTGNKAAHPNEGAWPEPPSEPSEASWEAAKNRLDESLAAVKAMIETEPME